MWIGSADLMHRNLDRRIEALVRLGSPKHISELSSLIDRGFDPSSSTWHLDPDGRWGRVDHDAEGLPLADVQTALIARQSRRAGIAP